MPETTHGKLTSIAEREETNKRQRAAVDQALAEVPAKSTSAVMLGGRRLAYRADAGFVPVRSTTLGEAHGEPEAAIFMTSYQLDVEGPDDGKRPVCFAFN